MEIGGLCMGRTVVRTVGVAGRWSPETYGADREEKESHKA